LAIWAYLSSKVEPEAAMLIINFSFLVGIAATAVAWLIYAILSRTWDPTKLFEGADRRMSTSKFQWVIWIWAIFFTYTTIYAARSLAQGRVADPITDIPENILAILGFSTLTAAVAKGVTQSYVSSGLVAKSPRPPTEEQKPEDLVQDDTGTPDPYKLQIFLWTLLAIGIYIASLVSTVTTAAIATSASAALPLLKFPDLDTSLMILSGLSSAGYLGKKIVTRDAPKISSVTPSRSAAGVDLPIVVLGSSFGPAKNGSMLNIGSTVDHAVTSWSNNEIRTTVPSTFSRGVHHVSVIVAGVKSNEATIELV
jgi:IPT/TIG domain